MVWAALLLTLQRDRIELPASVLGAPVASIEVESGPLARPKHPPMQKGEYRYQATGAVEVDGPTPRFRVFSQTESTHQKLAVPVARMLLRLWQVNYGHYGRDHAQRYNRQLVDVYLCETGEPGGEQLFGLDPDSRKDVNAIFIYDLKSFNDPLEMAREVAHEYGHATLPPVGGYKEGESWINGDWGEMIYLRALAREMKAGRITSEDIFGLDASTLVKWVAKEVEPIEYSAAMLTPGLNLGKPTLAGRSAFLGLAAYAEEILPVSVWKRALTLFSSVHASDYVGAVSEAVGESSSDVVLNIPPDLRRQTIWIPVKDKKLGGVKILARKDGWAKVEAGGNATIRLGTTAKPEEPVQVGES